VTFLVWWFACPAGTAGVGRDIVLCGGCMDVFVRERFFACDDYSVRMLSIAHRIICASLWRLFAGGARAFASSMRALWCKFATRLMPLICMFAKCGCRAVCCKLQMLCGTLCFASVAVVASSPLFFVVLGQDVCSTPCVLGELCTALMGGPFVRRSVSPTRARGFSPFVGFCQHQAVRARD